MISALVTRRADLVLIPADIAIPIPRGQLKHLTLQIPYKTLTNRSEPETDFMLRLFTFFLPYLPVSPSREMGYKQHVLRKAETLWIYAWGYIFIHTVPATGTRLLQAAANAEFPSAYPGNHFHGARNLKATVLAIL